MKRRIIAIAGIIIICIMGFTSCAYLQQKPKNATGESIIVDSTDPDCHLSKAEIEAEAYKIVKMAGSAYEIPTSWETSVSSDDSLELVYAYPPDSGMFMAMYAFSKSSSIENAEDRAAYVKSLGLAFNNFEVGEEKEIMVGGNKGYEYEIKLSRNDIDYVAHFVVFDVDGHTVTFEMIEYDTCYYINFSHAIESFGNIETDDTIK